MAIYTPQVNTAIERQDYAGPYTQMANQALEQAIVEGVRGAQQQAAASAQGSQERQNLKLQDLLKGARQAQDIESAKKLSEQYGKGTSVSVNSGGASISKDASVANEAKSLQNQGKAVAELSKTYNKSLDPINKQVEGASNLADVLNTSGPGSAGRAKAAVLGLFGLKRFNTEETAQNVPASLQSSFSHLSNVFGNDQDSLQESQRAELARFALQHMQSLQRQHSAAKENALGQYANNVYSDPSRMEALKNSLGAPTDSHLKDLQDNFAKYATPANTATMAQGGGQQGLIPKAAQSLGSLKDLLFGGGGQAAQPVSAPNPAPAPQQPAAAGPAQPQMSFDEFKRRKAAGQL